jgi:rSAM/selenodomain-associated transferase 1
MAADVKKGLIIFARKPVLGKVKTRLAATVGDEKALDVYKRLLIHTRTVAKACTFQSFAFLTEKDEENFWKGFSCQLQTGEHLGDRMFEAFSLLFNKGYKQCIIIGSDCPDLSKEIIDSAFGKLKTNDIVIGAAADGGYYLLGMKKLHSSLFKDKNWSTENVFTQTLMDIKQLGLSYKTMPVLNDLDEEKDVPEEWL